MRYMRLWRCGYSYSNFSGYFKQTTVQLLVSIKPATDGLNLWDRALLKLYSNRRHRKEQNEERVGGRGDRVGMQYGTNMVGI